MTISKILYIFEILLLNLIYMHTRSQSTKPCMSRYQLITYKLKGYALKMLKTNPRDLQLI